MAVAPVKVAESCTAVPMLAVLAERMVAMVGLRLMWFVYVQSTLPLGCRVMFTVAPLMLTLVPEPATVPHTRLLSDQPVGGADSVTLYWPVGTLR